MPRHVPVTGSTKLLGGVEMCSPGDNVKMEVELMVPIAMDDGVRFAIRESALVAAEPLRDDLGRPGRDDGPAQAEQRDRAEQREEVDRRGPQQQREPND